MLGNDECMNASDGHEPVVDGRKCTFSGHAKKVFHRGVGRQCTRDVVLFYRVVKCLNMHKTDTI